MSDARRSLKKEVARILNAPWVVDQYGGRAILPDDEVAKRTEEVMELIPFPSRKAPDTRLDDLEQDLLTLLTGAGPARWEGDLHGYISRAKARVSMLIAEVQGAPRSRAFRPDGFDAFKPITGEKLTCPDCGALAHKCCAPIAESLEPDAMKHLVGNDWPCHIETDPDRGVKAPTFDEEAYKAAHKIMTPEEYAELKLQGWHLVHKNVDGCGGVGIQYTPELPVGRDKAARTVAYYKNRGADDLSAGEVERLLEAAVVLAESSHNAG